MLEANQKLQAQISALGPLMNKHWNVKANCSLGMVISGRFALMILHLRACLHEPGLAQPAAEGSALLQSNPFKRLRELSSQPGSTRLGG